MIRTFALIAAAAGVAAAAGPAAAATRGFAVGGFDRIRSTGPFDVRVHTGGAPGVHASGPQEMLDRLRVEVRDGELLLATTPGSWWRGWGAGRHEPTVIDVSAAMIGGVTLGGPGDVRIDRVRAPRFTAALAGPGDLTIDALETGHAELSLTGPGDLIVSGRADSARITLTGPGDVKGARLTTQDVSVRLTGPGDVAIGAERTADVDLSGPGDVRIGGHPRCTVRKRGPGDVRCG